MILGPPLNLKIVCDSSCKDRKQGDGDDRTVFVPGRAETRIDIGVYAGYRLGGPAHERHGIKNFRPGRPLWIEDEERTELSELFPR